MKPPPSVIGPLLLATPPTVELTLTGEEMASAGFSIVVVVVVVCPSAIPLVVSVVNGEAVRL